MNVIYLESLPWEARQSPGGAELEDEIFRRNADKLLPLLRLGRNQAALDMDSDKRGLACGISDTLPQEHA
jgi:hypothetical protein